MKQIQDTFSSMIHTLTRGRYTGSLQVIPDALLYTLTQENILQYNVVCTAPLAPKAIVSGCDAADLEALKVLMGIPDAPEPVYTTQMGSRTLNKAVIADLVLNAQGEVLSIHVKSILSRPKVGISWKKAELDPLYPQFAETLERNGAYAVYLPCVANDEEADAVLGEIDGILMTGGGDFRPALFGQIQTPHGSQRWNRIRDKSDLAMTRRAIALDIPLLGICRGAQGLNIAMGGKLIQDIPLYLGQKLLEGAFPVERVTTVLSGQLPGQSEKVQDLGYYYVDLSIRRFFPSYCEETGTYRPECGCQDGHLRIWIDGLRHGKELGGPGYHTLYKGTDNESFVIDPNSKWLYDIIGSETMEFITSTHHQAIDPEGLGEGITIAAMASDGIVEAIEYKRNLFALGVQWHPERDALHFFHGFPVDQQLCNAPLRALVDHARIYSER